MGDGAQSKEVPITNGAFEENAPCPRYCLNIKKTSFYVQDVSSWVVVNIQNAILGNTLCALAYPTPLRRGQIGCFLKIFNPKFTGNEK